MSCRTGDRRPGSRHCPVANILGMTNPTRGAAAPAVDLRGVTKRFGSVTAVDNLTLTIEPGEIVAFLGPNGAGKTTTVDMLLGLDRKSTRLNSSHVALSRMPS